MQIEKLNLLVVSVWIYSTKSEDYEITVWVSNINVCFQPVDRPSLYLKIK